MVQKWDQYPGIRDLGTLGLGTRDPPHSLKVGPQDPLQSLKVEPPHLFLMNLFFSFFFK